MYSMTARCLAASMPSAGASISLRAGVSAASL
jgi:hypothetical protein